MPASHKLESETSSTARHFTAPSRGPEDQLMKWPAERGHSCPPRRSKQKQNACIAAGAKLRNCPRPGQSGLLAGQQYWVHIECAAIAKVVQPQRLVEQRSPQLAQPGAVTQSASDPDPDRGTAKSYSPPPAAPGRAAGKMARRRWRRRTECSAKAPRKPASGPVQARARPTGGQLVANRWPTGPMWMRSTSDRLATGWLPVGQ